MAETYKSKYTGEEIDQYLEKARTAVQPEDLQSNHSHTNFDILSNFTEVDGELYYKGRKVFFGSEA